MSEKRPFFSVIVPEHNSAEFCRIGLDSIRAQGFDDYELIVVCDKCDTKMELEIAKEYGAEIIETEFGHAAGARNMALDIARGDWILFMDDDDWYLPDAFEEIADELKRQPDIDVLAYGFLWKGRGEVYQKSTRIYPAIWNKAWRREFIGDNRFPEWIHTDDLGFARMMHPRARFGFLYKTLYYYNFMRKGSVSDRIRSGEFDNNMIPESCRDAAIGYEKWLKGLKT